MTETANETIAYCVVCGWQRSTRDHTRSELDWAILDHYGETGHTPIETTELRDDERTGFDGSRSTA